MGGRAQAAKEVDERNVGDRGEDDQDFRQGKPGRRPKPKPVGVAACDAFRHAREIFPDFVKWLKDVVDPRTRLGAVTFPIDYLLMVGMLMFAGQSGSRRQLANDLNLDRLPANLWKLLGRASRKFSCHPDTLNNVLEDLDPEELEKLIAKMVGRIRDRKMLRRFLCEGKMVVAIDGVQVMRLNHPPKGTGWLTTEKDGKISYSRYVLAACIVTSAGLVIPFAFEFVENPDGHFEKQDCELNASRRLLEKIRRLYPRTEIMIVGDALFEEEGTFNLCDELNMSFMITHKEKKLPSVERQLPGDQEEWNGCRKVRAVVEGKDRPKGEHAVRWQTPVFYHGKARHVIDFTERDATGKTCFHNQWITNIVPGMHNALDLAKNGRLRWKIENEGFNTAKNGGYEMTHNYGQRGNAWKNYCLLLQIGKLFNDLVRVGNITQLLADDIRSTFAKLYGNMHGYARGIIYSLSQSAMGESPLAGRDWQYRLAPA